MKTIVQTLKKIIL